MKATGRTPRALSIAGSDSGGGAGVQADLKAFAACGVHGMTAITAITAQNTVGVSAIHSIPPEVIIAQVRSVVEDIGVDAIKIGMLGNLETIEAVSSALDLVPAHVPVVLDPVMVSESGAVLLEHEARRALVELLPRVTVVTPNLPEAGALAGAALAGDVLAGDARAGALELARAILALGPRVVVITGGHRDVAADLFYDGVRVVEIAGERFPDGAAHGSGCTHSSVLAARMARGDDALTAARVAKAMAARAVQRGLRDIGAGPGPVDVLGIEALRQPGSGTNPRGGDEG
jgi:hydroxymethylpyrimidine/phosphomethylpyrimidine kinase